MVRGVHTGYTYVTHGVHMGEPNGEGSYLSNPLPHRCEIMERHAVLAQPSGLLPGNRTRVDRLACTLVLPE